MDRVSADEPVDLDELAAWCRDKTHFPATYGIRPADLQRQYRISFNGACSLLEALEARGDLERTPGHTLAWRPASAPQKPSKGYALPLSAKEHGALLRLLDGYLGDWQRPEDSETDLRALRTIRSRLKRPFNL